MSEVVVANVKRKNSGCRSTTPVEDDSVASRLFIGPSKTFTSWYCMRTNCRRSNSREFFHCVTKELAISSLDQQRSAMGCLFGGTLVVEWSCNANMTWGANRARTGGRDRETMVLT